MPTLPLIDLLILVSWTSLIVAGVQKLIGLALNSRPLLFGMSPIDYVLLAGVCLLFSLALAARVWVRAHEPALLRARRDARSPAGAHDLHAEFSDARLGARAADEDASEEPLARRHAQGA